MFDVCIFLFIIVLYAFFKWIAKVLKTFKYLITIFIDLYPFCCNMFTIFPAALRIFLQTIYASTRIICTSCVDGLVRKFNVISMLPNRYICMY